MSLHKGKSEDDQLAIDGGKPARQRPDPSMYPGGNRIGAEEEQAVVEVIRSKRLFRYYGPNPGPSKAAALEEAFATHMGAAHAAAVTSGTAALMCSLMGAGIGPGDEVIVPAYTWIASASAVAMVGAIPILAEVDESLTLDPVDAERKITGRTKALMPVHMRGTPARMDAIMDVAKRHGLRVIEDVAQADGGSFQGRRLGSIGDAGAFSLQFNKIITSGEGGMIITSDDALHTRILMLQDVVGGQRNNIPTDQILLGMNFRMPELLAAVALVQLGRLDGLIEEMRARKQVLMEGMAPALRQAGGEFQTITDPQGDASIALIFYLPTVARAAYAARALEAENISAHVMYEPDNGDYHVYANWSPILNQRTWTEQGGPWCWSEPVAYRSDMCPRTLDLLSRAVHLNVNPELGMGEIEETLVGLTKVLNVVGERA